ncbi:MAG: glycosyltransferase [Bacteroidota bacterium]
MKPQTRILAISEHYDPIVGGTTTYVKHVCQHLRTAGANIRLIHPGPQELGKIEFSESSFPRISIGLGTNIKTHYHRPLRYRFVELVNDFVMQEIAAGKVEIVHNLFGLFLTERLDVPAFQAAGVKVFNTIHNVPPEECSLSWPGDRWLPAAKEKLRLQLVRAKNQQRLKKYAYDRYIVPSDMVRKSLQDVLPHQHPRLD